MVLIKKYKFALFSLLLMLVLSIINIELGKIALTITGNSLIEMLLIIPPVFILLGLLDVWIEREVMMKYLGEDSGLKGILISIIIGSAAAGPLYGAFPIAAVFMKKGVKFSNILIFIGAWSTTKVPMFMFELGSLGPRFALTRLAVDIVGIIVMAFILDKITPETQKETLRNNVESL